MERSTATFHDWISLQKLLKSERLQLENGTNHVDQEEKQRFLATLKAQHLEYYRTQLGIRQERDKVTARQNNFKRSLVDSPGELLGNASAYVEKLLFYIRTTPKAFALLLNCTPLKSPQLELLLETINFSFFEDLVNTDISEIDLLEMLRELVNKDVGQTSLCTELFSEHSPNITGKLLILYTQRRSQRRFIKLMLKQTLIRIINTDDRTLHLDSRRIYREVKAKRRQFFANTLTWSSYTTQSKPEETLHSDEESDSLANLDEEVNAILFQMSESLQKYTLLLLDSVYNSLNNMPFAMRWLCRMLSKAVLNRSERNTVRDRNITLGTWVFAKWILVSVQSADLNGLLWDTQVTETNIANFGLIGRVIRHIYEESHFEEDQFESLNQFIQREM